MLLASRRRECLSLVRSRCILTFLIFFLAQYTDVLCLNIVNLTTIALHFFCFIIFLFYFLFNNDIRDISGISSSLSSNISFIYSSTSSLVSSDLTGTPFIRKQSRLPYCSSSSLLFCI